MRRLIKIFLFIIALCAFIPVQITYAETIEEYMNNLVAQRDQYSTMVSPAYIRNNTTEEYINPQNGELTLTQMDYVLPGRNGLDLEIKRLYKDNSSNLHEMSTYYNGWAWVDYIYSDERSATFYEDRYNLGVGWRFSFPTIEINHNNDGSSFKFLHTDSGDVYRLIGPTNGFYTLENHPVKDLEVKECIDYNNGQYSSAYVVTEKNGKKTYFSSDGFILGIVDRYGNSINFEYTTSTYTVNGYIKTKKLITKITDTIGRAVNIEYKEDQNFQVTGYDPSTNTCNGDLQDKFQVIIYLPDSTSDLSDNKKLVYNKSCVMFTPVTLQVIKTRIQKVIDIDNTNKYWYDYEQLGFGYQGCLPGLGFTFYNGTNYSVHNVNEYLYNVVYSKTNREKQFVYATYTKKLNGNSGSMQYRKVVEKQELFTSFDGTTVTYDNIKDKTTYTYTNEADGFGYAGYNANDTNYLKNIYKYYSEKTDMRGAKIKYTYNGIHELINTENYGNDHKEVSTTYFDANKLPNKKIMESYNIVNGQPTGGYVRKVENYIYDAGGFGNLISYSDSAALRDSSDNPVDSEHTVNYTYDTNKYHVLTSKTWKKDASTTSKIEYDLDAKGNVIQERRINTENNIIVDFQYDVYGNITKKILHYADNSGNTYVTNYEYAIDADSTNHQGSYLTKEYNIINNAEVAKKYIYDFYTGNKKAEIDENGNRTGYEYDLFNRVTKITYIDGSFKRYIYNDLWFNNKEITYIDCRGNSFLYVFDILGNQVRYSVNGTVLKKVQYDSNNNKTKEIDANGHATRFEYDSLNRLKKKSFWENDLTEKKYMTIGYTIGGIAPKLVSLTNEEGYVSKYYYDIFNRLTKLETTPDNFTFYSTTYSYDYVGNKISTTDNNGNTTIYNYDQLNRLRSQKDALNAVTQYNYDAAGRMIQLVNPKNVSVYYEYDPIGRLIRIKNPLPNNGQAITRYLYDNAGNKVKEIQPNYYNATLDTPALVSSMPGISYTYDNMNRLVSTVSPEGTILETKSYDANGNVKKVVDGLRYNGNISTSPGTTYIYDALNRVTKVTNALGFSVTNTYDMIGNLIIQVDARNNATIFEYYSDRTLKKVTYSDIGIVEYTYDKLGRKLTQKDQMGNIITYVYNGFGLISTTDSLGRNQQYYFDANGNTTKIAILRSTGVYDITKYEYDKLNRVIKVKNLVDESDIYNAASLPGIGNIRDPEYPGKVQLITGYEYDVLGNKTKTIDPRAYGYNNIDIYSIRYSYNVASRLETVTQRVNGLDIYVQYFYDSSSNKIKERNTRGYYTEYTYDNRNRLKTIKDALGQNYTYTYDILSNKTSEMNAKGDTVTYTYDTINRLYNIKDPNGVVISTRLYDGNNNLVKQIDAKGYQSASNDTSRYGTVYVYDKMNRLTQVTDPMGGVIKYEYNTYGLRTKETDQLNNSTSYEYDLAGRLTKVTDPLGTITQYTYDKTSNKLTVTDGRSKVTLYSYGAFNILVSTTDPENKSVGYKYDLDLNATKITDKNGNDTILAYDIRNLLLSRNVVQTGDSISYTYDDASNRKSMTDVTGTSNYIYNENNLLTSITKDGVTQLVYTYDQIGNITSVTDKKGYAISYTYDKLSRMSTVNYGGKTTTYTYDANGNRSTMTYTGGVNEVYTYDKNNKILTLINKKPDGVVISSYNYVYDLAGRQVSKTDSYGQTTYNYDAIGRITQVTAPGKTTIYNYDGSGNRLTMSETYTSDQVEKLGDETVSYKIKSSQYTYSDANKLINLIESLKDTAGNEVVLKSTMYTFDNNGNQTQQIVSWIKNPAIGIEEAYSLVVMGTTSSGSLNKVTDITVNSYDGFNRLTKAESIKQSSKIITEYQYNGDDLRVKKTVMKSANNYTADITNFLYDRGNVILETDTSDNVKVRYIKGINYIARIDSAGILSYFLFNGHGDVVHTVTEVGVVENNYDYDIFGNATLTVESYDCGIRYAGEFYDKETGLYYLRARYYNPYIGRFISEDSYWGEDTNPLSLNLYTYCVNNPIRYIDPTGHMAYGADDDSYTTQQTFANYQDAYKQVSSTVGYNPNEYSHEAQVVQQKLIAAGYNVGACGADGYFGNDTLKALNDFKDTYLPDGNVGDWRGLAGQTTIVFLDKVIAQKQSETINAQIEANQENTSKSTNDVSNSSTQGTSKPEESNESLVEAFIDIMKEKQSSPYSAINYWSAGTLDMVKGAFNPEKPLSLEHWVDSAGTVLLIAPAVKAASTSGKTVFQNIAGKVTKGVASTTDDAARVSSDSVQTKALQTYYPPNDGFLGKPAKIVLEPGTKIDRYGYPGGYYTSPVGTPAEMRALPPGTLDKPYNLYKVVRSVEVTSGQIAPWFGQPGMGTQHVFEKPIHELIEAGILRKVGP